MPPEGLAKWLRSLPEPELIRLLTRRPDALAPPEPRSFAELADRLSTPHSTRAAIDGVDRSTWQLVELLQSLGGEATLRQLRERLGVPERVEPELLEHALDSLRELGLAWPGASGETVRLTGQLKHLIDHPLRLGRPLAELLPALTVEQLSMIGELYGHRRPRRKAEWITLLTDLLTDADAIRARLAALPPQTRELVTHLAWNGPIVRGQVALVLSPYGRHGFSEDPGALPVRLGWVLPAGWEGGEMPREVALAIRGPGYRPSLEPFPPPLSTVDVHSGHAASEAKAAVQSTVDGVRRLLEFLGRTPLATLRTGGVGVRELGRASKALKCKENELRLWLETLSDAGMVATVDEVVLPTEAAEAWSSAEPVDGYVTLLQSWYSSPRLALDTRTDEGRPAPALRFGFRGPFATSLRRDLLDALANVAPAGIGDMDRLVGQLAWRRPARYRAAEDLEPAVQAVWTEMQMLGLLAARAITPLGAALNAGEPDQLRAAAAELLPTPATEATFLPDLTALVAGTPSVELARLLDSAADQESRDAASSWRFSPASVRRALDAGATADTLLADLHAVAQRPLPQPLTYLVRDVARRHGQLRVLPVTCCVLAADSALATEIASHRALAPLKLRVLAGTVLASAKPVAETLAALRAAGYAPVRHSSSGDTVVEREQPRRAPAQRVAARYNGAGARPADPAQLVKRLHAAPIEYANTTQPTLAFDVDLAPYTQQLSSAERRLLAHAVQRREPVLIEYVSSSGTHTSRVIEPDQLVAPLLIAWCRLRDGERHFLLDRITAVAPAL